MLSRTFFRAVQQRSHLRVNLRYISSKMGKFTYPSARKTETTEVYHQVHNLDNKYDWLEQPDSEETVKFNTEQNKITREFLDQFPKRDYLKQKFEKAVNYWRGLEKINLQNRVRSRNSKSPSKSPTIFERNT